MKKLLRTRSLIALAVAPLLFACSSTKQCSSKNSGSACATEQPSSTAAFTSDKTLGKVSKGMSAEITAIVMKVDPATRLITLKVPNGEIKNIIAGPEVRNFAQIKAGDKLRVAYETGLALELKKGAKRSLYRTDSEKVSRAQLGQQPGAELTRTVTALADVKMVDYNTGMVTLRGPKQTVDLKVRDPEQLANIKVGDQVEATYTEAVAIAILPPNS